MFSAASVQMSVPPGRISSAARKPVSPGPAASSSTRWPGWSRACSSIHADTGIPNSRMRSACLPHPAAARSQRATISASQRVGIRAGHVYSPPESDVRSATRRVISSKAPSS